MYVVPYIEKLLFFLWYMEKNYDDHTSFEIILVKKNNNNRKILFFIYLNNIKIYMCALKKKK